MGLYKEISTNNNPNSFVRPEILNPYTLISQAPNSATTENGSFCPRRACVHIVQQDAWTYCDLGFKAWCLVGLVFRAYRPVTPHPKLCGESRPTRVTLILRIVVLMRNLCGASFRLTCVCDPGIGRAGKVSTDSAQSCSASCPSPPATPCDWHARSAENKQSTLPLPHCLRSRHRFSDELENGTHSNTKP